ncbi:MAG: hypothetical protein JHD02_00015 [Thermoleophilaceae bacterium]|nr:hypothetical protein [Thermoleophilaceae bacterium]
MRDDNNGIPITLNSHSSAATSRRTIPLRDTIAAIALICLFAVPFAPAATATADPVSPVADECYDSIDNDGDGTTDIAGSPGKYSDLDIGCEDDTPTTEQLTQAPRITLSDATEYAGEGLSRYYGARFNKNDDEWFDCWRKTRVEVSCRYGFVRHVFIYSGVIRIHSYQVAEEAKMSFKRRDFWRGRDSRFPGADEITILNCTKNSCATRLTYYN